MLSPQPRTYPHADDGERIARARQAAEALFRSKPPVGEHKAAEAPGPAGEPLRKPRVLAILPPAPLPPVPAAAPPGSMGRSARRIPPSEYARIRTWVEYGMTAAEVADVYRTTVGVVERILRAA